MWIFFCDVNCSSAQTCKLQSQLKHTTLPRDRSDRTISDNCTCLRWNLEFLGCKLQHCCEWSLLWHTETAETLYGVKKQTNTSTHMSNTNSNNTEFYKLENQFRSHQVSTIQVNAVTINVPKFQTINKESITHYITDGHVTVTVPSSKLIDMKSGQSGMVQDFNSMSAGGNGPWTTRP